MEENMNLKIKFYNNHFTKKIDNKKGMNIYNQNGQEYLIVERDYIYLIKMNLEADCLKVQFISDASTKELKMMIERLAPVEVGLMVKTWGNGGFLEVDFKESQAIISNK